MNHQGVTSSADAGGVQVYVFAITPFSIQSIRISPKISDDLTILGPEGPTVTGWALAGAALAVIVVAALVVLRKRR